MLHRGTGIQVRSFRRVHQAASPPSRCTARLSATRSPMEPSTAPSTAWAQSRVELKPYPRGCHIITKQIYEAAQDIGLFEMGIANIFCMHTSASLTINENASPDVPLDLNDTLDRIVPEGRQYRHDDEGPDDMPAHVKSSLMGASLTIPISQGRFTLGTWQGIYLNEHRNSGGSRTLVITIHGQKRQDGRAYRLPWQQ